MTRKDYVLIANAVKRVYEANEEDASIETLTAIHKVAYSLARDLKAMNPAFDTSRFVMACGV